MTFKFKALCVSAIFALGLSACGGGEPSSVTVFVNGQILTMNEAAPSAEALAIDDGIIIAVGAKKAVMKAAGKTPNIRDLDGKTLTPGLIDAHGHFGMGAMMSTMADLQPPPAGPVSNFEDLAAALVKWRDKNPDAKWIVGMGYDDSLMAEGRHPTRDDLDKISSDTPIMLIHVSGHLSTCNSACLEAAGVTAETQAPPGGVIRRKPGSMEPDGVLEETAMKLVRAKMPIPGAQDIMAAVKTYQSVYASHGITTAQEGAASQQILQLLSAMGQAGQLKLDVVAYPMMTKPGDLTDDFKVSKTYENHVRVGGIKLILDGSPQGKTAWLTQPYHVVPEGAAPDYAGYAGMTEEDVEALIEKAFKKNAQVIAHANGDAAADQLLTAVTAANKALGTEDRRTVMIHAQTARDDQIAQMKTQGVIPSYFVAHTFYWGDWHRDSVFGEARAARISPLQSTLNAGVPFTVHNDAPIVPPDMMRLLWAAVNRETRSGKILGEAERVTPLEALKAMTLSAAYQNFEEDIKGSLEAGKLADLVILSDNPLTISKAKIKDIKIIETLKEGQTIFPAR